jgi:hypothetical protein
MLKQLPDEYVQELLVFSGELKALSLDGLSLKAQAMPVGLKQSSIVLYSAHFKNLV